MRRISSGVVSLSRRHTAPIGARRALAHAQLSRAPGAAAVPLAAGALPAASVVSQRRFQGSQTAGGGKDPKTVLAEARVLLRQLPPGCSAVTSLNLETELAAAQSTPTVLYFHAPSNAEVLDYTRAVLNQVSQINKAAAAIASDGHGGAAGATPVVLRCGLIDCERDWALAQQFRIQPDLFPLFYFLWQGQVIDKMYGIHPEAQVSQAFREFIIWVNNKAKSGKTEDAAAVPPETQKSAPQPQQQAAPSSKAGDEKPDRVDEYDENAMTLQAAAVRKTQSKEYPKAFELFTKARGIAEEEVKKLKIKLGVANKKLTPEISDKLRKDQNYLALPQTICGQAMVRLAQKQIDEAYAYCQEVRKDFAWAVRDNRQIADTLCRVELIKVTGFDMEKDNYITLMKNDEIVDEPAVFYKNQMRLAVAHWFERHPEIAIEELLKLIRAEAKLLPALQKAGIIAPPTDGTTPQNRTPARRAIFCMFESLGNAHGAVVDARKKLAAFLYT